MSVHFNITHETPLCEIMNKNKSDKGNQHNYTKIYYNIFKDIQLKPLRIFELGLGTNNINLPSNMGILGRPGASLYGWSEFFINSEIFGADIDKEILFKTDRINTFYCDQTNPNSIKELWKQPELNEDFDIIVEDGLHTFNANVCFFENSIHKLKVNGYYIIEDIANCEINLFKNQINIWIKKYNNLKFSLLEIPINNHKSGDNNLLLVTKI
jgi:hypothetical protein